MGSVYISSTYQDLAEYRHAAAEAVRRAEHQPIGMEDSSATEKRPLEKCLEDVRKADAYVGLIGWRYGFVPPGQTLSITRLEYEEAGRHTIPRLIFLSPESDWPAVKRDSDLTAISDFRARLRLDHTIEVFENIHDLKFRVVTAVRRQLGDGVAIPPLLPYRCDRTDQYDGLAEGMRVAGSANSAVCIVHGEEPQAVNQFLKCVREDAGSLMGAPSRDEVVGWKEIAWPTQGSPPEIRSAFLRSVGRALAPGVAVQSLPQVAAMIDRQDGPLVVHSRVFTDEWSPERALGLVGMIEDWRKLRLAAQRARFLLLLTVEYREPEGIFSRFSVGRRNKAVRNSLTELAARFNDASNVLLVRELGDVRRHDAEEWAETEPVQRLIAGADIRQDLAALYGARGQIPMRPLARDLEAVLNKAIQVRRL